MTDETRRARIETLNREHEEFQAKSYEAQAEIDVLEGDALSEEFHRALAASWRHEPNAYERKERAYVRLQAKHILDCPDAIRSVAERDRPAIAAEAERLKATFRLDALGADPRPASPAAHHDAPGDTPQMCGHTDEGWEAFPCTRPKGHQGEHACTGTMTLRGGSAPDPGETTPGGER